MIRSFYGIMIKYPDPGKVKTRLAKDIGEHKAAEVCRIIAGRIMKATIPVAGEFTRIVLYDPPERVRDFTSWFPGEHFVPQRGDDVGERMHNGILDLIDIGAEKVVITGSDIPDLNAEIISSAFAKLDEADIVIGPAKDGGYYLIGMTSPHREIFRNIPWSTETVFRETMDAIERLGLLCQTVRDLSDVDTKEDLGA